MSLFGGLRVSASALSAERLRLNVIAENIANAETTRTPEGGPYRRREVILASGMGLGEPGERGSAGGVHVAGVLPDPTPPRLVHDPSHPDANAEGYVAMPNVDVPAEVVDMMAATRAYEANALALQSQRRLQERALELLA
ncbi:MAG: flagellar basal body rod protein FlgC [Armatimonadetes bacterium]|nr:flagellar basal body rod protein FlgC [Armatimonadota bacterium]